MLKTLNTIERNTDVHVTKSQDVVEMNEDLQNAYSLFVSQPRSLDIFERGDRDNIDSVLTDNFNFNTLQRNVLISLAQ